MLTVSNQGGLVATVRLLLRGEAAGWSSCTVSPFQLMPGEIFQAELDVHPPPAAPPGLYPLQIEAVSEIEPDENFTATSIEIQVQGVGAVPDQPGCLTAILQRLFPGAVILLFWILLLRAGYRKSP